MLSMLPVCELRDGTGGWMICKPRRVRAPREAGRTQSRARSGSPGTRSAFSGLCAQSVGGGSPPRALTLTATCAPFHSPLNTFPKEPCPSSGPSCTSLKGWSGLRLGSSLRRNSGVRVLAPSPASKPRVQGFLLGNPFLNPPLRCNAICLLRWLLVLIHLKCRLLLLLVTLLADVT